LNKLKKIGQCAYCGCISPVTDDHIPPKNLFPKPRSSNLITVPCCLPCFEGWSKDDEYFRATILASFKTHDMPLAEGVMDSLLRSLKRSPGFANLLINSIEEIEMVTESGIYLGKQDALKLDGARVNRVSQRIIRGLFLKENKYPLPENYEVVAKVQQFGFESILENLPDIQLEDLRIIQNGVFCYTFCRTNDEPNSGLWLLLFYKHLPIAGFIRPKKIKELSNQGIHTDTAEPRG